MLIPEKKENRTGYFDIEKSDVTKEFIEEIDPLRPEGNPSGDEVT